MRLIQSLGRTDPYLVLVPLLVNACMFAVKVKVLKLGRLWIGRNGKSFQSRLRSSMGDVNLHLEDDKNPHRLNSGTQATQSH